MQVGKQAWIVMMRIVRKRKPSPRELVASGILVRHSGKLVMVVGKATWAATVPVEEVATQVGLTRLRSAMRAGVSGTFGTTVMQRNIKWRADS